MLEAEATITEDPELTYWFTGLTDMNDDHVWEWEHSILVHILYKLET